MLISTNGNNLLTSNYFKDFIQSENNNNNNNNNNNKDTNSNLKSSRIQDLNYNINNIKSSTTNNNGNINKNFTATNFKSKQNENKVFNNIKVNTQINANNNNMNPNLKAFESSKTFSTKNANGKKIVFNERSEKNEIINNNLQIQQLIHQASNNNLLNHNSNNIYQNNTNTNNNLNERPNNLNRFTKIGKENSNSLAQKSTDKIKNLFANKFA